ncbi:MAG: DUF4857 domain-containing protein [Prevotellaceae bacterium]|jgi:hypothetical protein|nr:DUF4857 domain-containing protein [Prevotellaceae bacterium]
MKGKQIVFVLILIFVTVAGLWGIPELVKTATYTKARYPFVYFSSIQKKFLMRESDGRKEPYHDDEGKIYSEKEYDSSLPLLNYRQLTVNGEMPEKIDSLVLDPREIRVKQMTFRYSPSEKNTPETGLYIMYESLPKKAKLESPGDVFRLKESIEFIDAESNTVNAEKSELFQSALLKAGFVFPAQWTYGNLSIRKPYDEGYFSLDAEGKLFHVKMVNGRPYVRNTQIALLAEPAFFSMLEVADKRFYGFLFDKKGNSYILEADDGKYKPVQLDIAPFDIDRDEIMIMGNLMYWTVSVQSDSGKNIYALETESLKQLRSTFLEAPANRWHNFASWLFPVYLDFKATNTEYIAPNLHFTHFHALTANLISAIIAIFAFGNVKMGRRIFNSIYSLVFGIAGLASLFFVPFFEKIRIKDN